MRRAAAAPPPAVTGKATSAGATRVTEGNRAAPLCRNTHWFSSHARPAFVSVLGCPIVKKRKLEEAEENQSAPKKRNQPVRQAAGEDFAADNDTTDEDENEEEEEGEEEEGEEEDGRERKEKKKTMTKIRAEVKKGERAFSTGGMKVGMITK